MTQPTTALAEALALARAATENSAPLIATDSAAVVPAASVVDPVVDTHTAISAAPEESKESKRPSRQAVQATLEKLFELYPVLFGANFLPLKLGVFQELLAAHPAQFQRDTLKAALGVHTRSARYLQCVAAGLARHDLQGAVVEPVSPEHVYLSLLELFRCRQSRAQGDLRPQFRAQLVAAFEASGLSRQDYQSRVQTNEAEATALLEEALAAHDERLARTAAVLGAYRSSGKTPEAFADMYGLNVRDVRRAIDREAAAQSL